MAKQQTVQPTGDRTDQDGKVSASQVISVRLPVALADEISELAARRGLRSSDLVKVAVEEYMRNSGVAAYRASADFMRLAPQFGSTEASENSNPVERPADIEADYPPDLVSLGL